MLDAQIISLKEQGASTNEIARELACDPRAVDYVIAKDRGVFNDEDQAMFGDVIRGIAREGENERNRLSAAIFGLEVSLGIKSNRQQLPNFNAAQINQLIIQANNDVQQFISAGNGGATKAPNGVASSSQEEPPILDSGQANSHQTAPRPS